MPIDHHHTALSEYPLRTEPLGPFAQGVGTGIGVPLIAAAFGGLGGGAGFFVAAAILAIAAFAVRPSVDRAVGIVVGFGIAFALCVLFFMMLMRGFS